MGFKPGDVVLLRSGGPSMTVVSVDEDEIKCVWIGEEGELFRQALPSVALDRVETEDDLETDEDDDEDEDEDEDQSDDEDEDEDESEDEEKRAKAHDDDEAEDDAEADREEERPPRRAGRG
jgi:uncharacterized protein YodC (DUF2158 family)